MNDLRTNHYLHGVGIAGLLYLITKNAPLSIGTGAAAGFYMTRYGHSFPSFEQRKPDHKAPTPTPAFLHSHIALEKKDGFNDWMSFMGTTSR